MASDQLTRWDVGKNGTGYCRVNLFTRLERLAVIPGQRIQPGPASREDKEESHAGNEDIGAKVFDGHDNLHLPDQPLLVHADTGTLAPNMIA